MPGGRGRDPSAETQTRGRARITPGLGKRTATDMDLTPGANRATRWYGSEDLEQHPELRGRGQGQNLDRHLGRQRVENDTISMLRVRGI